MRAQKKHDINAILAICILLIVLVASLVLDAHDDLDGRQANYCEMRAIYIDSGGEYGWPMMDNYGECK